MSEEAKKTKAVETTEVKQETKKGSVKAKAKPKVEEAKPKADLEVKEKPKADSKIKEKPKADSEVKEKPKADSEVKEKPKVDSETKEEPKADSEIKEKLKVEEVKTETPQEFLDNFNWYKHEQGIEVVDKEKLKEFELSLDDSTGFVNELDLIEGTVIRITDRDVIIDIQSKSEGVISLNEFRYNPELAEGDKVEVLVDKREDYSGQLILSHKKARVIKSWERIKEAQKTGEIVSGTVKCRTRGGMIVDIFGIESFLPGSQIDVKPIKDYEQFVGKTMEFKVVKINHEFKNIVVSHKVLIEADIESQKKEIIGRLEKGQVLEGVVKNITSYGVFVDLGGIDGLIHVTDLSWSRINHPSEAVEIKQKLNVVILDFDNNKSRIQLGLKQLITHPWKNLDPELKPGSKIKGKIVVIADYGAFAEISKGVEGLIHVSEMSWSTHLRSAHDFVKVGDEVEAQILAINREERKISLGTKQLTPDPWENITTKFPVGSIHKGKVINYTSFGVFIELEKGIDGLVYISDLSWTKKIRNISDFVTVGDTLEVKVLELNVENRKISLGHKQTKPNPWDAYESKYTVSSTHEGAVKSKNDKGAIINFEDGADGFAPMRFLDKKDGTQLDKGEKAKFVVIEFSKEHRRIVISHSSTYKEQEKRNVKASVKKASEIEKATFGDVGGLADLKKKMETGKKK